ncbi:MAG: IS1595 family transposase [Actinomycetota bacterium]|nr:IS1595 family transposase [Actinomycetota bacterium]
MAPTKRLPRTLVEAIRYFEDPAVATEFVAHLRWPDGPECPSCGGKDHSFLTSRRIWKCKACKKQFSVKVGTIFEDSPIPLDKWLASIWLIANAKNGISSHELGRSVGLTQKSAWFVLHRVRLAMQTGTFDKLTGEVEVDETFVGGKAKFMHQKVRSRKITGRGYEGKTAVMGMLERDGDVRAVVVPDTKKQTLTGHVHVNVEPGSAVYSDAAYAYSQLGDTYTHGFVDHAVQYVNGRVHTNGIENFWSLLKRSLKGTYVSVEPFHLFRYVDEQVFRFNLRKDNDLGRFVTVTARVSGRRLSYSDLTGKA